MNILLTLLLISGWNGTEDAVEKNRCYPAYPFQCYVNRKIDKNILGMVCYGPGLHKNAVLQTTTLMRGGPIGGGMQYVGHKVIPEFDNGFDADVDFWKVCSWKQPEWP